MEQTTRSHARSRALASVLASRRHILQGVAVAAAGIAVGGLGHPLTAWADDDGPHEEEHAASTILRFAAMAGIQKPFLGDAGLSAFRGIHGGGAPWVLRKGKGVLTAEGHLRVRVRGLVLDPASVPAPAGGTNPVPSFMAIVSGFSTDPSNPVNLATGLFPASTAGDADIEATLSLPHPFFAPLIFVTSLPLGMPAFPRWFAVTGLQ
jgi:hypothetical protein